MAAELEDASAEEALRWALETFNPRMYIACSFQKTSSVTVHMAHSINPEARFFYLDTDVLFPETYETKSRLEERYGINFHRYSSITLEQQKGLYGDELWGRDPDACCGIRKVEPMRSALAAVDLWVSGIRRSDSQTRAGRRSSAGTSASGSGSSTRSPTGPRSRSGTTSASTTSPTTRCTIRAIPRSAAPTARGSRRRARTTAPGRWAGLEKTECGLHG